MCQPKYWNKIYTKEVIEDNHGSILTVFAERSDLEIFELEIVIFQELHWNIAKKIKKAIDSLESYRDCDCTAKLGTCIKHLNDVAIQGVITISGPKSAVTFGRR